MPLVMILRKTIVSDFLRAKYRRKIHLKKESSQRNQSLFRNAVNKRIMGTCLLLKKKRHEKFSVCLLLKKKTVQKCGVCPLLKKKTIKKHFSCPLFLTATIDKFFVSTFLQKCEKTAKSAS